jgi:hypothetical protein
MHGGKVDKNNKQQLIAEMLNLGLITGPEAIGRLIIFHSQWLYYRQGKKR